MYRCNLLLSVQAEQGSRNIKSVSKLVDLPEPPYIGMVMDGLVETCEDQTFVIAYVVYHVKDGTYTAVLGSGCDANDCEINVPLDPGEQCEDVIRGWSET